MWSRNKHLSISTVTLVLGIVGVIMVGSDLGVVSAEASPEATSQSRQLLNQFSEAFEAAASEVSPSVVSIFAEQSVEVKNPFGLPEDGFRDFFGDEFFKHFFGTPPKGEKQTIHSLGSGVIVSPDGYILTNNHVVAGAEKLTVVIKDKKRHDATVVGTDPQTDVAVVKIDAADLPVAALGNSDEVKIGQWVIAVGNPFQLAHTVTAGIISAKGRSSVGLAEYEDFIQTDASINPGNSGGALADLQGNVVGINTAISSPSGGNVGIGFAIPINMARHVMEELIKNGKVTRGYVGIMLQDIDENLAKAMKLKDTKGALVADVVPDGPGDKAGLKRGDVIIAFEGQPVENTLQLRNLVADAKPKSSVKLTVRRDGREMDVKVVLGERPKELSAHGMQPEKPQAQTSEKLGISIQTLTPEIAKQLGFQNEHGVVVTDVTAGSAAEDAGLRRGDLIQEVNRAEVRTAQDFNDAVADVKSGDTVALLVRRGQATFFVAIQMP